MLDGGMLWGQARFGPGLLRNRIDQRNPSDYHDDNKRGTSRVTKSAYGHCHRIPRSKANHFFEPPNMIANPCRITILLKRAREHHEARAATAPAGASGCKRNHAS